MTLVKRKSLTSRKIYVIMKQSVILALSIYKKRLRRRWGVVCSAKATYKQKPRTPAIKKARTPAIDIKSRASKNPAHSKQKPISPEKISQIPGPSISTETAKKPITSKSPDHSRTSPLHSSSLMRECTCAPQRAMLLS